MQLTTFPYHGRIRLYKLKPEIHFEEMPNYGSVVHTDDQNRLVFPNQFATGIEILVTSKNRRECQLININKPSNQNLLSENTQVLIETNFCPIPNSRSKIEQSKDISLEMYLERAKLYFEGEMRKSEIIMPIWNKYIKQAEEAAKRMSGKELAIHCMTLGERRSREIVNALNGKFAKPENYFWKK